MTKIDYLRIWQEARNYARRRGFGDESEDFASEYVTRKLEGKGLKQSIEQYFIDYSEQQRTNKRLLSSPAGYLSKNRTVSIDQPFGGSDDNESSLGDFIGESNDDLERAGDTRLYLEVLMPKERVIFQMFFNDGFTMREIAKHYGVSESRICQRMQKIEYKIQRLTEGISIINSFMKYVGSEGARRTAVSQFIQKIKEK